MKQTCRAFVAIDEGGRYAISGGTHQDDDQHIEAARSGVQWINGLEHKGQVNVYAIEVELETPKHTRLARVVGLIEDKRDLPPRMGDDDA